MMEWLNALSGLERLLLYIAVPATLILLIQAILLLIGLGGGNEADAADSGLDDGQAGPDGLSLDLDGDGVPDDLEIHDGAADTGEGQGGIFAGLHVFTVRGFVTFFTLTGWSGLLFCQLGLHPALAVFLAIQIGVIGMVGVALLLREALRLQSDGTLNLRNAVGMLGSVYLTIPAARSGAGKVSVLVQEQLRELEAVTDGPALLTGAEIMVTGITGGDTLVVKGMEEEKEELSSEREEKHAE